MTSYQRGELDSARLRRFFETPPKGAVARFVDRLGEEETAAMWFAEQPPVWADDPAGWVRGRFAVDDWYAGLSEPEMLAWDHAVTGVYADEGLKSSAAFSPWPGDGMPMPLFEAAGAALRLAGEDAEVCELRPLRCNGLPAEVLETPPQDRVYWPQHAVVTPEQAARMVPVFERFGELTADLDPGDAAWAREWRHFREPLADDAAALTAYLRELVAADATWFAWLDC